MSQTEVTQESKVPSIVLADLKKDTIVEIILKEHAKRERPSHSTNLDSEAEKHKLPVEVIVAAYKKIEAAGGGSVVDPRDGTSPYFEWGYSLVDYANAVFKGKDISTLTPISGKEPVQAAPVAAEAAQAEPELKKPKSRKTKKDKAKAEKKAVAPAKKKSKKKGKRGPKGPQKRDAQGRPLTASGKVDKRWFGNHSNESNKTKKTKKPAKVKAPKAEKKVVVKRGRKAKVTPVNASQNGNFIVLTDKQFETLLSKAGGKRAS